MTIWWTNFIELSKSKRFGWVGFGMSLGGEEMKLLTTSWGEGSSIAYTQSKPNEEKFVRCRISHSLLLPLSSFKMIQVALNSKRKTQARLQNVPGHVASLLVNEIRARADDSAFDSDDFEERRNEGRLWVPSPESRVPFNCFVISLLRLSHSNWLSFRNSSDSGIRLSSGYLHAAKTLAPSKTLVPSSDLLYFRTSPSLKTRSETFYACSTQILITVDPSGLSTSSTAPRRWARTTKTLS